MNTNNSVVGFLNFDAKNYKKDRKKIKKKSFNMFNSIFQVTQTEEKKRFILLENGEFNLKLIKEMLDKINNIGERLLSEPSKQNVLLYKKAISEFLSTVISSSISVKEQVGGASNKLKRPKYRIIKIVNEKLDKLAYSVLQNQFSQIRLLSSIEEIKGLLVNLLK